MQNEYLENFNNIASNILFVSFKVIIILFTILLITSLIMLAIGCLIKSQKIKSKFLKIVPGLIIGNIFFLSIPFIYLQFKNLMQ